MLINQKIFDFLFWFFCVCRHLGVKIKFFLTVLSNAKYNFLRIQWKNKSEIKNLLWYLIYNAKSYLIESFSISQFKFFCDIFYSIFFVSRHLAIENKIFIKGVIKSRYNLLLQSVHFKLLYRISFFFSRFWENRAIYKMFQELFFLNIFFFYSVLRFPSFWVNFKYHFKL